MSPGTSPYLPSTRHEGWEDGSQVKGVPIPLGSLTLAVGIWLWGLFSSHPTCSLHMVSGEGKRLGLYHRDHCPEEALAEAM